MDHADHVALLRDGVRRVRSAWADLGAGTGAFTVALADLLPAGSTIYAIDRDGAALAELERESAGAMSSMTDVPRVQTLVSDFRHDLPLTHLDGVVMANSLHFVKDKLPVLARVRAMLKPGGTLLLVEYDTDDGNTWVPYPLAFGRWRELAVTAGFGEPRRLGSRPSRFLRSIYSAACERPI